MIKIENVEVVGWKSAIRGMRNPKNSWDRCDSQFYIDNRDKLYIGPNDHKLMKTLANSGPVHAKYRRMITVYVDITAPLYWWKEFDTYKVGTVANSCSTMHKIHSKEFDLDDFSTDHLSDPSKNQLRFIIDWLNRYRYIFNNWESVDDNTKNAFRIYCQKDAWWQMIQLLPSSYNQRRTVMLNYEVLANVYMMRKNHKLDEWRDFCEWIKTLPYSELIITKE